jgi:GxxExxY protein
LKVALGQLGIPFRSQAEIEIQFRGIAVGGHRMDLVVGSAIVVELKAVEALKEIHFAQLKSYLKATGLKVGLLFNFNSPTLVVKRVVL